MVIVFILVILIVAYFLSYSYYSQLKIYRDKELTKLQSIANTLSLQIDGEAHNMLFMDYKEMDAIKANDQIDSYYKIYNILNEVRNINNLQTTLYTMVFNEEDSTFQFGVSTSDEPFFRHPYKDFPEILLTNYEVGGVIPPYIDENGTWLSAFAPIKVQNNKTIGVIQVDEKFDTFIKMVRKAFLKNSLFSVLLISIITFILIRIVRKILREEETIANQIIKYNELIEEKNKNITASIRYAKKIQDAVFIPYDSLSNYFPESFIFYHPRDIVSGDFYWNAKIDEKILFASVDCTGHGVPGAFMSLIGNILLKEIVNIHGITRPADILNHLNIEIKKALVRKEDDPTASDGMDMAICSIDLQTKKMDFAGALRPLIYIREEDVHEIKGDRFPIGGGDFYGDEQNFTNHTLQMQKNDLIVLFSDGITDQFGGEEGRKFLPKRFKQFLFDNRNLKAEEIHENLKNKCIAWKGEHEQVDDILVIGIRL